MIAFTTFSLVSMAIGASLYWMMERDWGGVVLYLASVTLALVFFTSLAIAFTSAFS